MACAPPRISELTRGPFPVVVTATALVPGDVAIHHPVAGAAAAEVGVVMPAHRSVSMLLLHVPCRVSPPPLW